MTVEEAIKVLDMFLYKQCDLERTAYAYDQNTVWHAVQMGKDALKERNQQMIVLSPGLSPEQVKDIFDKFASSQPEIIRCKECKHYKTHTLFGNSQSWCERWCDGFDNSLSICTEPDDYCSYGEEREDEQSSIQKRQEN